MFVPAFWLVVAVIAGVIEAATSGVILVWFVVGALVAFVFSLAGAGSLVQVVVFLAVSIVCLLALRPVVIARRKPGEAEENVPEGQRGVVTERIDNEALTGAVRLEDGVVWTARSQSGAPIEVETPVRVVSHESIKLFVEPVE